MTNVDVICHGCGTTGSVGKVTASLVCGKCGHGNDLDLYEPKTAAGYSTSSPEQSAGGKGSTGWTETRPNVLEGWDEYQGPAVGSNPLADDTLVGDLDAYNDGDWSRGNPGYIPGGGYDNAPRHLGPTTGVPSAEQYDAHQGPQSGGARWQGEGASLVPLHVTLPDGTEWEGAGRVVKAGRPSSNPMGSPEDHLRGTYSDPSADNYRAPQKPDDHSKNFSMQLDAQCPNCGNSHTELTRDHKDDGWWHCPKCGPLANIDQHPEINPSAPPFGFTPDRSMKVKSNRVAKAIRGDKSDGQIIKMTSVIKEKNAGLSNDEALELARRAVLKFGHN